MQVFSGSKALSAFKTRRLLAELKALAPSVQGLTARFAHLAQLNAELTEAEEARLQELLHYGEDFNAEGFSDAEFDAVFVVAPRVGTIPPWSSKATDIARNCDLFKVDRLERVTAYWLQVSAELTAEGSIPDRYFTLGPYRTDTLHFIPETSFTLLQNQKGHLRVQL